MKVAEYDLLTDELIVRDATPEEIVIHNEQKAAHEEARMLLS